MKCGLLGRKLSHSYSPRIHNILGDYSYELFETEPEDLGEFLKHGDWDGINVTVPYKETVIPYLDELTPIAKKLVAVNTIVRRNGKLIGHNTDYFGFLLTMRRSGLNLHGKKALILGSGGASHTAAAVLEELGAQVVIVSRTGVNHYENLHIHRDASVLVNTTPVGMFPDTDCSMVNPETFPNLEGVIDVIYNPARTKLLQDAEKLGIYTTSGLLMLVAQAKEAAEWFTGRKISDDVIDVIHRKMRYQMENIILIGMPGCGKTTVGKLLARQTGRRFVDADAEISAMAGKSIPAILESDGEEVFRNLETKALAQIGKQSGLVIATGGGCVTRERNYPLLHQNGSIVWLMRDLTKLPSDGRPLSRATPPEQMYQVRRPMYEAFADHIINNNGSIEDTIKMILEVLL